MAICRANCSVWVSRYYRRHWISWVKCVTLRNPDVFELFASYAPCVWPGNATILNKSFESHHVAHSLMLFSFQALTVFFTDFILDKIYLQKSDGDWKKPTWAGIPEAEIWTLLRWPCEELSLRIMGGSFVLEAVWRLFNLCREQYFPFHMPSSICMLEGRTFTTQGAVCSRGSRRPNLALRDLCHLDHKLLVCFSNYFLLLRDA